MEHGGINMAGLENVSIEEIGIIGFFIILLLIARDILKEWIKKKMEKETKNPLKKKI